MIGQAATGSPRKYPGSAADTDPMWHSGDGAVPWHEQGAAVRNFTDDVVDEWGRQSFPASDPPPNW